MEARRQDEVFLKGYLSGKKDGRKEVVEWIKASGDASLYSQNGEYTDEWQAKLKEWGIE